MKLSSRLFIAVFLALVAGKSAFALCNVALVSVSETHAVLKANCGATEVKAIDWLRNGSSLGNLPLTPTITNLDIHYRTPLVAGISHYTATATDVANNPVAAGTETVVTIPDPVLTVAAAAGGSVTSSPLGINACTSSSGVCTYTFAPGSAVTLTPTGTPPNTFAGWGGDCSGTGACTAFMTSNRTVTANFVAGTPPSAPTIGTATAGSAQISVSFTPGSLGTGNLVQHTADCNGTTANGSTSPITVAGLTNGTLYTCKVNTTTTVATSAWSGTATATPAAITVPGAPTNVSAAAGSGSITVSFSAPGSTGGAAIDSYRANCGGTIVTGSVPSITVSGLTNGTAYSCTAEAHNSAGWGAAATANSATPSAAVTVPGAPTGVSATAGDGAITVSFSAPGSTGGAAIDSYRANCGGTVVAGSAPSITVSGLTNGTAYSCTVEAHNSAGWGAAATANSVTPAAAVAGCGAGQTFGAGDFDFSNLPSSNLNPSAPLAASGDSGASVRFMPKTSLPNGITINVVDQSAVPTSREIVISACPHSFVPLNNDPWCSKIAVSNFSAFYLSWNTKKYAYNCPVPSDKPYYLNIRSSSVPREAVSSQFSYY